MPRDIDEAGSRVGWLYEKRLINGPVAGRVTDGSYVRPPKLHQHDGVDSAERDFMYGE
jgi:hypothetical protein